MQLRRPWYAVLYVQVLIGIVLGGIIGALGAYDPSFKAFATSDWMKALGDGFVSLIKMVITPIIFCTIVFRSSPARACSRGSRLVSCW